MERYWLGDSSGGVCNYPEWKAGWEDIDRPRLLNLGVTGQAMILTLNKVFTQGRDLICEKTNLNVKAYDLVGCPTEDLKEEEIKWTS